MGFLFLLFAAIGTVVFLVIVSSNDTENSNYSTQAEPGKGSYGRSSKTNSKRSSCGKSPLTTSETPSSGKAPIKSLADMDINKMVMESLAAAKTITPYYKLLEEILINNLKCLPKSVLEMEFTQTAIQVFILQYASAVLAKKLSNTQHLATICELVVKDLHEKGVLAQKNFAPNLDDTDPLFRGLPMLIQVMSQYPPQNQTMLLIVIEQYMERKEGHKVRYIGQCPADNPLNASK